MPENLDAHKFNKKDAPRERLTDPKEVGTYKVVNRLKSQMNQNVKLVQKRAQAADELRKSDHMYSDLFGQSGRGGHRSPIKQRAEELLEGTHLAR